MKNLKYKLLGFILIMSIFIHSCGILPTEFLEQTETTNSIKTKVINGYVKFPFNNIQFSDLEVMSLLNVSPVNHDGAFTLQVPEKGFSLLMVVDKSTSKIVAFGIDTAQGAVVIDETTTALGIILFFPFEWNNLDMDYLELINAIQSSSQWNEYLELVTSLMRNDPIHLLNYQKHPRVLETAISIVNEIVNKKLNSNKLSKPKGEKVNHAYIIDKPGDDDIIIRNPKATPYGISAFDFNGNPRDSKYYKFFYTPIYVNGWGFKWWILPEEGEAKYKLGDGEYIMILARPDFEWLSAKHPGGFTTFGSFRNMLIDSYLKEGQYVEALQTDAIFKGVIGAEIYLFVRMLNILSVLDPTEASGVLGVFLDEMSNTSIEAFFNITFAGSELGEEALNSFPNLLKFMIKMIKKNVDFFIGLLSRAGIQVAEKTVKVGIENLLVVLDVVDALENEFLIRGFLWDILTADRFVYYKIHQKNGNAQIVASLPPENPSVTVYPFQPVVGNPVSIVVTSSDPENKKVKYFLLKRGWYDYDESPYVSSGESYTFIYTPITTGKKNFTVYALDEDGAMSGPKQFSFYVTSGTSAEFYEDFESYTFGLFSSNVLWQVEYKLPSEVRISKGGINDTKTAKFIDYDPAIGYEYGYYAHMYSYIAGQPQQISFYMKVDDAMDNFGVRAWPTLDGTTVPSFYVVMANGWLRYVNEGIDPNNALDFVPVTQVKADTWYKITLNLNWTNQEYDLYVNDTLVKQGIKFISYNWGMPINASPYFQVIAFIDAQCRGGYIDDIMITGSTFNGLQKIGVPDIAPQILKQKISLK